MKISTKILIGAIASGVALCMVNAFAVTPRQFKIYNTTAQSLALQLGATPIKVVDITLPEENREEYLGWSIDIKDRYSRNDVNYRRLNISIGSLESVRISADTLYMDSADGYFGSYWAVFTSPELETVVIHTEGRPDEVFDYRQPEPEPETTQLEPEGH